MTWGWGPTPPCQPPFTALPEGREGRGQRDGPLPAGRYVASPAGHSVKSPRGPRGGQGEGGAQSPQSEKPGK